MSRIIDRFSQWSQIKIKIKSFLIVNLFSFLLNVDLIIL